MAQFYDARGNIYAVIAPQALRDMGVVLPVLADEAARERQAWASQAVAKVCNWPNGERPHGAKAHRSDGLLIGPFQDTAPFDVLIVNTDGTLAERSGNGLTIFAQSLQDGSGTHSAEGFALRVHHDHGDSPSPVVTHIDPAQVAGVSGFWLDIGTPGFGPETVGVVGHNVTRLNLGSAHAHRVERLAELHPDWNRSVFVRVGNPHCVTLVPSVDALPGFSQLHESPLNEALTAIAFAFGDQGNGDPCPEGINLQWAAHLSGNRIMARVFERGEGPTASSGTSASAVASAAWLSGWVKAGRVEVVMPGGTAPLELHEAEGRLVQVRLFGTAVRQATCGRTD